MNSTLGVRLAAITLVFLAACRSAGSSGTSDDLAANRALNQQFAKHLLAKNWDACSHLYAENAVVMPPNSPTFRGRAAIRDYLAAFPPLEKLVLVDDAVEVHGDMAYCFGHYEMTIAASGSPKDAGCYMDIRKRQPDGSWKYVAEVYSSSMPLPTGH